MAWLLLALMALAGAFRAVHDTLTHSQDNNRLFKWAEGTRFEPWVDAVWSWKNKYKHGNDAEGPAFPGSTTVFVAFTDLWHFSNLLAWACVDAAFLVVAWPSYRWVAVGCVVLRRCVFQPLYSLLRK